MNDEPDPPVGVVLRDPEDTDSVRADIERGMMDAMKRYVHGYTYGGVRLELGNLRYVGKDRYSVKEQKEAKLNDRLLSRRLKADVKLVDENSNEVLDTRTNMTLARVPWLTQNGTFINNGSEFSPVMQSRLLPGAYTRRRENGELETHFNTRAGTGPVMRVTFDPVSTQYRLKIGTSNLHAYSVFKDMGVSDEELERRWGPEILEANRAKYSRHAIDRAYKKAVPKWERDEKLPVAEKARALRESIERAQVAEAIMKRNLANLYSREKAAFWRRAGAAVQKMQSMVKEAAQRFEPDLSPDEVLDQWMSLDCCWDDIGKTANFEPDLSPDEMRESYNSIYGHTGPRLASMRRWPEHWLDDQDEMGWLQWYRNYHDGRRSDQDDRQIARWKAFKARHGAQFVANPTPRRAFALMNWGIDPVRLLPEKKRGDVRKAMEKYRRSEYMKWALHRHDFMPEVAEKLARKARERGAEFVSDTPGHKELMLLAEDGYIQPEDLS